MPRLDILEKEAEIRQWIQENQTKAFICKQLHCKPETLNSYLKKMGIEYAGNPQRKGVPRGTNEGYKPAIEYIQSTTIKSHILKQKLIRDGLKEYKCEICGNTEWQGQAIPLELHHKDGNHYNNQLENLQILCPNCHALQNGNSGANIPIVRNFAQPPKKEEKHYYCIDCGKEIYKGSTRCKACASKIRNPHKVEWPTREELKNLIRTIPFTQIGTKYGVSDKGVSRWCKVFGLPSTKKEIKSYTDEEWQKL